MKINGQMHDLWRAAAHEGEVLESFASWTFDVSAALKYMKKLMERHGRPQAIVTGVAKLAMPPMKRDMGCRVATTAA